MNRKLFAFVLALLLLGCMGIFAFAAEVDPDEKGSVTIKLYGDKKVTGGLFHLYKVGRLEKVGEAYQFSALEAYKDEVTVFQQRDLDDPDLPKKLEKIINKKNSGIAANYKGQFKNSNTAVVEDVETGVYLVVQQNAVKGYAKFSPFLITVPRDGKYDVTSNSKVATPSTTETTTPETTKPSGKLPQTGQLNWPVPVLAAAGLTLFTIGSLLRRGRKEEYEG